MNVLTHYIVVRRDLPVGDICAQIAHAAGESFYRLGVLLSFVDAPTFPGSSVIERQVFNLEVGGSIPSRGANFDPSKTVVVVLGARNENKLARLERQLTEQSVAHVSIRETDGPWSGQLMAVGLVPGPKDALSQHVREFHMIRFEASA